MKLKEIKLKKLIEILVITAALSTLLLGLVVWIFDIPAYMRGEKGAYAITPENSIAVNVSKSYKIEGITSIDADLRFSDIDVSVTDSDSVSFVYTGSVISRPDFEEPFLVFSETTGRLTIRTTFKDGYSVANSNVVLKLSIPENKLKELKLATSSGDIHVTGTSAEILFLDASSGEITVNGFSGDSLNCESSSGYNDLLDVAVNNLSVSTSSGKVTLRSSSAESSFIETSSGDILISDFSSAENKIDTTSGSAELENFSGNLDFSSSSGLLRAAFEDEGDEIIADTSSGDVVLLFDNDAAFTIKSETSSGEFIIDFPMTLQGTYDNDHIRGKVGDGSGLVKISTSSGDITIKSR